MSDTTLKEIAEAAGTGSGALAAELASLALQSDGVRQSVTAFQVEATTDRAGMQAELQRIPAAVTQLRDTLEKAYGAVAKRLDDSMQGVQSLNQLVEQAHADLTSALSEVGKRADALATALPAAEKRIHQLAGQQRDQMVADQKAEEAAHKVLQESLALVSRTVGELTTQSAEVHKEVDSTIAKFAGELQRIPGQLNKIRQSFSEDALKTTTTYASYATETYEASVVKPRLRKLTDDSCATLKDAVKAPADKAVELLCREAIEAPAKQLRAQLPIMHTMQIEMHKIVGAMGEGPKLEWMLHRSKDVLRKVGKLHVLENIG